MTVEPILNDEKGRLEALEKYNLLDSMPADNYTSITEVIAAICVAPISLITLVDKERNFMKATQGIDVRETPRDDTLCLYTINNKADVTVIEDARVDKRFQNDPLIKDGEYGILRCRTIN